MQDNDKHGLFKHKGQVTLRENLQHCPIFNSSESLCLSSLLASLNKLLGKVGSENKCTENDVR